MGTCITLAGSFVLAVSRLVSFWAASPMLAPFLKQARPTSRKEANEAFLGLSEHEA